MLACLLSNELSAADIRKSRNVRCFPLAVVFERNSGHELEIQATSTDQSIDSNISTSLLNLWEELINDLCDGLQGCRCGFVAFVLASPFSTDPVEAHGTIRQGNISQRSVGSSVLGDRNKGLQDKKTVRVGGTDIDWHRKCIGIL